MVSRLEQEEDLEGLLVQVEHWQAWMMKLQEPLSVFVEELQAKHWQEQYHLVLLLDQVEWRVSLLLV